MKTAKNIAIAIITAPEILLVLVALWIWQINPNVFLFIGEQLSGDVEVWGYLNFLPVGMTAACYKFAAKIRAPGTTRQNKQLYEWPKYRYLVARVNLALIFVTFAALSQVALWVLGRELDRSLLGLIFCATAMVLLVVTASLGLASMKIGEVLTQYGRESDG